VTDLVVVEKLEGWEKLKTLVLDSVSSPITKRVYNIALNEFLSWFQLAPELAAGISRLKSAKPVGDWLSARQAQALLNALDITTLKGLRDRAILAVLIGCGLRRSEAANLTFTHLQQRDGRWCIVDLVGNPRG
jgi:site-specific recombinase XerD